MKGEREEKWGRVAAGSPLIYSPQAPETVTSRADPLKQSSGRCKQCHTKTHVYQHNGMCGECCKPWDNSAAFCLGCATFYQYMNQVGEPSRSGHLTLQSGETAACKCPFCKDTDLVRPPNTASSRYLRRWIERMWRYHRRLAYRKRRAKAPAVAVIGVTKGGAMFKQHGPAWLGLAKGDLFRRTADPRIIAHDVRLIVPVFIPGTLNISGRPRI